jgi:hypothetical protein
VIEGKAKTKEEIESSHIEIKGFIRKAIQQNIITDVMQIGFSR